MSLYEEYLEKCKDQDWMTVLSSEKYEQLFDSVPISGPNVFCIFLLDKIEQLQSDVDELQSLSNRYGEIINQIIIRTK